MSYATTSHYEAEILFRNRLAPPPEPTMGNNPGRNTPLNRTDDIGDQGAVSTAYGHQRSYPLPGRLRLLLNLFW
jgi:hypothetical protein